MNLKYWCSPIDVIATIIIIGGFIMMYFGIDSTVKEMTIGVTVFYFGLKTKIPGDGGTQ